MEAVCVAVETDGGAMAAAWAAESGNALVELALVFALLGIPMLLGTVEMGTAVYDSVEISNAANAGALYGCRTQPTRRAARESQRQRRPKRPEFGTNLTVTPTTFYVCTSAVGGTHTARPFIPRRRLRRSCRPARATTRWSSCRCDQRHGDASGALPRDWRRHSRWAGRR